MEEEAPSPRLPRLFQGKRGKGIAGGSTPKAKHYAPKGNRSNRGAGNYNRLKYLTRNWKKEFTVTAEAHIIKPAWGKHPTGGRRWFAVCEKKEKSHALKRSVQKSSRPMQKKFPD